MYTCWLWPSSFVPDLCLLYDVRVDVRMGAEYNRVQLIYTYITCDLKLKPQHNGVRSKAK